MSAVGMTRLWLRPLWQRPRRAAATVLGVAVGVASVLATGLASRAAVASLTDDVEAIAGDARLEVTRPGGVPVADMALLAPVCGDVRVEPVVEGTALAPESDQLVRVLGVDFLGARAASVTSLATDAERLLRERGVLLARSAAERLGVARGETLRLSLQSRIEELEVLEIFEPERFPAVWERIVLMDIALAQELLGRREHIDRLELVPRHALDEDELAARVRALLPPGTSVAPASKRRAGGERFVRSLTFNLGALAGVSVLVAIVLVATTLATSVVQRRPLIALMRSLGASRTQIGTAVLLEAALIGLLGGALGVLLGWLGAQSIASGVHGSFATLDEDLLQGAVSLEPAWILAGLAIGLGSALAASFLPLREALNTPPVQHLRSVGVEASRVRLPLRAVLCLTLGGLAWLATRLPPWGERPVWALVATLLLLAIWIVLAGPLIDAFTRLPTGFLGPRLGTPLRLAQASLAAARGRTAWAASAVGLAVALAVAMSVMVGSFRANVLDWTAQTMRSDLYLRPLSSAQGTSVGHIAPEVLAIAEELFPGCVDPYRESRAEVNGAEILLGGAALDVVARAGGVPFLDGRDSGTVFREAFERRGALVNEPFSRRLDLGRGDRVRISAANGVLEREIVGVYRDFSGHIGRIVIDQADFLPLAGDEGAENVAIFLPEGADVAVERERLRSALGSRFALEILDNRQVRDEVLRVFERTFAVTTALQAISALVAALAVVLVLTALVKERERELAIVRVLGGSRFQLGALVAGQALFLGLAGALGGLAVGVLVGWVLVAVVNVQSFGWSLRFTFPPSVLLSTAMVVPACLAAGWIPAWMSLRLQPREALREPD